MIDHSDDNIDCPYCGSTDTDLFSLFGQQLLTVQYYCNSCRTPFERVKGEDVLKDARRRASDAGKEPGTGYGETTWKE